MSAELEIYSGSILTEDEKKQLDMDFDKYINANKTNRQNINKLVFQCVAAMTTASDTEKQLADKKGISRFIGGITGSNKALQDKINANRSAAQFAMQVCLQKLAAQNLMTFDLITAVNNKLNASLITIDAEFKDVRETMIKFFKKNRSELVRLEAIVEKHEKNINLLNWQNSIEYQEFNGTEYEYLDPITKIVCLTRDFYDITQGDWSTSDLLLLKTAMDTIGIAPKAKVNYYDALKEIANDEVLKTKLLGDLELYPPKDPACLISFAGLQKISALNNEESYVVDTIADYVDDNDININRDKIEDTLTNKFLANIAQVDVNIEMECYDLLLDLLYNLKNYESEDNESENNNYSKSKDDKEEFNSNVRLASDIEYVKEFANKGNARAMYLMAIYYSNCFVDIKEAKKWMKKSAEAGDPLAKFRCDSSPYNFQLAADIKILAEKGDSYACYEMGHICEKGYNGQVDRVEASKWYHKAAELNNQQAEYVILLLKSGRWDRDEEIKFFEDDEVKKNDNKTTNSTNENNCQSSDSESKLENYCISNILQVPSEEIKKFINKNITLRAYINCEGTLEFENCIITYNDDLTHYKIELAKNAELHIKNCIIRCKGFDKESFIISNGSNKIKLEQSTFEDCSNFLVCEYYNDANDITIENNKFQNCAGNVFYLANDDRAVFNHNFVIVEKFAEFNDLENSDMKGIMFWLNKSRVNNSIFIDKSKPKKSKDIWEFYRSIQFLWSKGKTENCRFYGLKDKVECVTFKNCYFEGCNACLDIQDEYKGVIDSCVFKNCTKIANFLSSDEIVIKNCQFIDCYNNLIETGLDGGLKIEYCDFINIKEIKNDQYGHFCIELKRSDDSDSNCNFIRNCIFRGIKLDQRFLIGSSNIEKVDGYTGRIEKCTFENCITNRSSGQIIKHYIQYTSFFREKDDYTITDENCVGLDKVNRYVSNDGRVTDYQEKKVGAVITEDEVGCKLSVQI